MIIILYKLCGINIIKVDVWSVDRTLGWSHGRSVGHTVSRKVAKRVRVNENWRVYRRQVVQVK